MQESLFDGEKKIDLALSFTKQKKALSKNQLAFNRLTARIAKLRKEIELGNAKMIKLSGIYNTEIIPLEKELALQQVQLATALANASEKTTLTPKQKKEIKLLIIDLLQESFETISPDTTTQELFNRFSRVSYTDLLKGQEEEMKQDFQEDLFDMFGVDVNMDSFDGTPESFTQFQQEIKQKIEQQQSSAKKKKSKTQQKKESLLQQQEEIKKRSIRSIYMRLAKLLHPDTETDETVKKEKEEIMKDLTRSYNENDLSALLKLELQWIATENDHLEKLTDDTLAVYTGVLKDQVKELEIEKISMENNPAFEPVRYLYPLDLNTAVSAISHEREKRAWYIKEMKEHISELGGGKLRNVIRTCIEKYFVEDDDFDSEAMAEFHEMMKMLMTRGNNRK